MGKSVIFYYGNFYMCYQVGDEVPLGKYGVFWNENLVFHAFLAPCIESLVNYITSPPKFSKTKKTDGKMFFGTVKMKMKNKCIFDLKKKLT